MDLLCPQLKLFKKGKIREVYDFDDKLLIVVTDKVSAFDVVLPDLIKGKGALLNKMSNFWFDFFKDKIKNHVISTNVLDFPPECMEYIDILKDRSMFVWKTKMIPTEAIVRGYLSGSGYSDYLNDGYVCGMQLPDCLMHSSKLEQPIFTPSTKNESGNDVNISEAYLTHFIKSRIVDQIKEKSLYIYKKAAEYALKRGIIIADTKFEFGLLNGEVILIDEILTPDSSRFWDAKEYMPGQSQKSYDKQIIRDYLSDSDSNKLPDYIIQGTIKKYQELYEKLL